MFNTGDPITIEQAFAEAAESTRRGEAIDWKQRLIMLRMIDIDQTRRDHIVCVRPDSVSEREQLSRMTMWLQPHAGIDPVIDEVLVQMEHILKEKI